MELIKGSSSLFYIIRSGIEVPVGCLTSNPIEESAEMMETTTRDNEGWRTSIPTLQSYTIALDGYMTIDDPNSGKNVISYRELRRMKRDKELIVWKIKTLNGWYVDSGKAYIESISFSDPVDDMIGFSASLVGYGIPNDTNAEYDIHSDEVTYNFTYSHLPENDTNAGQWFITNLLFNNYRNAFGVAYDCKLQVQIISLPAKGFLANNITRKIITIGEKVSYCDKDDLVFFPNGFNNDLGISGNFSETFSYKIIDQDGHIGRLTTHTIIMTDTAVEPIDLSVSIVWGDDTSAPKTGTLQEILVKVANLVYDPADPVTIREWQGLDGDDWKELPNVGESPQIPLQYIENKIRLKLTTLHLVTAYSNILTYTKSATANIYVTDRVPNYEKGTCNYKLHVEGMPFVGFANTRGKRSTNSKNAWIKDTNSNVLTIPVSIGYDQYATDSTRVVIPVGVYDCRVEAHGFQMSKLQDMSVDGGVSYGFTQNYDDGLAIIDARLRTPAG